MPYFEYSKSVKNIEYFEILEMLMERWEFEIVEFKEAKGGYDTDKIGRYFSAISNEANYVNSNMDGLFLELESRTRQNR